MMRRIRWWKCLLVAGASLSSVGAGPALAQSLGVDHQQVAQWNRFADALIAMHRQRLAEGGVDQTEKAGGYANYPNFYREVSYFDSATGGLVSRIKWERDNPDRVHSVEVFEYDDDNRLVRDYVAVYLPEHRNAPIQTLVNLHHHDDGLHAFRQFDASGARIYEQCKGQYFGEPVMVSLDEDELPIHTGAVPADVGDALYASCFDALPTSADAYLTAINGRLSDGQGEHDQQTRLEEDVALLSGLIEITPDEPQWYLDRGLAYFNLHQFDDAVTDLTTVIKLAPERDEAWFWRGMARGRAGDVHSGIADLSRFIERNPNDSRAYTKRGVRYIWVGEFVLAQADLERAVSLDDTNAEAHDDLGVIYAQQERLAAAEQHFLKAIAHDPTYQKAYHNLAMIKHLAGDQPTALARVETALRLEPESRNALLLKAAILQAMGRRDEALAINEQAEFLPEGNWSERFPH